MQVTLVALLLVVCAGAFRWSERPRATGGDQGLRREQRRVPSSGAERHGDLRAGSDRAPGGRGNQEPSKRRREHAPERRHPPAGLLRDSSPLRKDSATRDGIDGDAGNRVHVKGSEHSTTRSSHQQERPSQSAQLTNAKKRLDGDQQNAASLNATIEMKEQHLDLIELMRLDGHRGDQGSCIRKTESLWSVRNERMMREVMRRIRNKKPVGWIRFADGDMNHLGGKGSSIEHRRMVRAISAWPSLPNLVVSVGEWWLCTQKWADIWRRHFQINEFRGYTFHSGCFYLPMGTPDDDDRDVWAGKGIQGWVRAAHDANVTIVLVGPRGLAGIPWLTGGLIGKQKKGALPTSSRRRWVDTSGVSDHAARMDTAMSEIQAISASDRDAPFLFVFSAGHGAKTMITELMHPSRQTSKDIFIDAGTALDGFAGVHSREFNSKEEGKRKYCENILRRDPVRIKFWIDPKKLEAVCDGVHIPKINTTILV